MVWPHHYHELSHDQNPTWSKPVDTAPKCSFFRKNPPISPEYLIPVSFRHNPRRLDVEKRSLPACCPSPHTPPAVVAVGRTPPAVGVAVAQQSAEVAAAGRTSAVVAAASAAEAGTAAAAGGRAAVSVATSRADGEERRVRWGEDAHLQRRSSATWY